MVTLCKPGFACAVHNEPMVLDGSHLYYFCPTCADECDVTSKDDASISANRPTIVTQWAAHHADLVYASLVSTTESLQDTFDDVSRIARAIQKAYDRGYREGKADAKK